MPRYHTLTVTAVEPDTREAILVTLEPPAELRELFRFREGQHLNLRAMVNGEELRRSYSLCCAPDEGRMRIAIKRAPGGRFSNWANQTLCPGMAIEALPPTGRFHPEPDSGKGKHYLAIAAGSGITPVFSLIKTILAREPQSRVTLWYGNRASGTIMLREELAELKDRYLSRFALLHVMSREHQDIDLFNGRLTAEKCAALADAWCPLATVDEVLLCGPYDMNRQVAAMLESRGFDPRHILVERFASAQGPGRSETAAVAKVADREAEALVDGRRYHFAVRADGESILEAGLRAGVELRYSCKSGVCATCRAKLVAGEVDMDGNFALEDYEIARGFILTCQSYPVTPKVVVDFDQDT